ncbi:hypothetical protein BV20DRAFT_631878 [Pilatotrama ljubarskyi]|nr:hypothetical protein BV20DRAFT_631878 [Pilatotrama ljubarskyi]
MQPSPGRSRLRAETARRSSLSWALTTRTRTRSDRASPMLGSLTRPRLTSSLDTLHRPLPPLDAGSLPSPYITLPEGRAAGPSKLHDPDVEQVQKSASSISAPAVPAPPPEVTADGQRLTKKEVKKVRGLPSDPLVTPPSHALISASVRAPSLSSPCSLRAMPLNAARTDRSRA